MVMYALIDDGYTRTSGIYGVPGMFPDVTFTWRGLTVRQRARFKTTTDRLGDNAEAREEAGAELIASHVLEWDVKSQSGLAPITKDNVLALHPLLFNVLYRVITMTQSPDWDADPSFGIADRKAAEQGISSHEYLEKNL